MQNKVIICNNVHVQTQVGLMVVIVETFDKTLNSLELKLIKTKKSSSFLEALPLLVGDFMHGW